MVFVKQSVLNPLTKEQLERITEINLHNVIQHQIEFFGTPAAMNSFLVSLALGMAMSPDDMVALIQKVISNPTLPPKKEELIEIYYRADYSRRKICKIVRVHDSRITDTLNEGNNHIRQSSLDKAELIVAKKLLSFYTETAEVIL